MKKFYPILGMFALSSCILVACDDDAKPSSDQVQRAQQEQILQEGSSQVGMPAIKNFREKRLLKEILEMRDQVNVVTYTYLSNAMPSIAKGHTALGGKLTFLCVSNGYPIPYATQYTNPLKDVWKLYSQSGGSAVIAQADPNGLFSPSSASGTWVICKDPSGVTNDLKPIHVEENVIGSPFRFPED